MIHNDIGAADGEFDIFMNVTTADVQRVAKTYFTPNNRVVLHILPKERRLAMTTPLGSSRTLEVGLGVRELGVGSCALRCRRRQRADTPTGRRSRPPRPLPPQEFKFPPYEIRTLANGMQVMAILHHEQPAVTMRLLTRAGAAQDPTASAASPSSSRTCWIRARPRGARSRSPSRSTSSAARSAPGPAPT